MPSRSLPRILRTTAAALAAGALIAAHAAANTRPAAIEALAAKGVSDIQELQPRGGLRIFAGVSRQSPVSIYLTRDGHVIVGTRIDQSAEPMDLAMVSDAVSKSVSDANWRQLEAAKWVRDGKASAPRTVYVFSDPNCPWCHRFWEAARPHVEAGRVQLRHILVGIIRADSAAKAAAILESRNPSEALEHNERTAGQGGIAAGKTVSAEARKTLAANLQLMQELGFSGTPAIVYQRPDGSLGKVNGFPQERLAEVLGAP